MKVLNNVMAYITGLVLIGGSACAWRYWHMDPLLSAIFAFIGIAIIGSALPEKGDSK